MKTVTLSKFEFGKRALTILQYRVRKGGSDLRPEEFAAKVNKMSQKIGCTREEALDFFQKFMIPHMLAGCGMKANLEIAGPTEAEARIARKVLTIDYFTTSTGLVNEAARIAEKTRLPFDEVAAIARYISQKHLNDEFEEHEVQLELKD